MSAPGSDRARAHRLVAVLMLLAALGGIALATLGAGADRGSLGSYDGPTREAVTVQVQTQSAEELPEQEQPTDVPEPPERSAGSDLGSILLVALLASALIVLTAWLLLRMRALNRPSLEEAEELPETEELTVEQARDALEDARQQLSTMVDAQDAVIAAWLTLERAIATVGIRRRASQTTLEYVVDVLGGMDLDAADLDRLAHLYRRALFDAEPLTEADRDQAVSLLDALTGQLEQQSAAEGAR